MKDDVMEGQILYQPYWAVTRLINEVDKGIGAQLIVGRTSCVPLPIHPDFFRLGTAITQIRDAICDRMRMPSRFSGDRIDRMMAIKAVGSAWNPREMLIIGTVTKMTQQPSRVGKT
jgi:hypothetical protein